MFWVFICRLCMAVLILKNIFMEQRYFLASRFNSLDWFHLQRYLKRPWKEKEICPFCLVVKIGRFLFAGFARWIWFFFYGTEVLSCFTLEFFRLVRSLPMKMIIILDISVAYDPLANSKANVLYKKMQKNVWMHTVDKIKRFPAIKPPIHAIIYTQQFL